MENKATGYCLILAGGIGSRLWPESREDRPKQFLDLFGTGRTLLQQTYDRYASYIRPENIYISTNERYRSLVKEQLPSVPDRQILCEPIRRGTLASVAWGALVIAAKRDAQANIVVTPADQLIFNEDALRRDILDGLAFAAQTKALITLGIRPTRPATGYGYIQTGQELAEGIYRVKSFTEKPALEYAKMFVESGEFYWNAGLFIFNVQSILEALTKQVPEYQIELPRMLSTLAGSHDLHVPEFFAALPKRNIDYGIMERGDNVCVKLGHFGWADLGTWENIGYEAQHDAHGNLLLNTEAILHDAEDNIIALPHPRRALVSGLKGYVIAESDDVLLIAPKDDAAAIRRLHNEARLTMGIEN